MLKEAVYHQSDNYVFPESEDTIVIQLRVKKDELNRCYVLYNDRYSSRFPTNKLKMEKYSADDLYDYFRARVALITGRFQYLFFLEDEEETYWYTEAGFFKEKPQGVDYLFRVPYIYEEDVLDLPEWVNDSVCYQIFIDRFCNGYRGNDPHNVIEWGKKPTNNSFFGGDLQGIIDRLDYLEFLGVNLLYFTPIFKSPSNHKYDTTDYYEIDPSFGNKEVFKRLVEKAHKKGIKIILDGVFNHCGENFFAFRDVMEKGAESKYFDWFKIDSLPVRQSPKPNYETFANELGFMPKLRTDHQQVQDYLLDVAKYWTEEFKIDGWRLDVGDEINSTFWRRFRRELKKINPELYIAGEAWSQAQSWLKGDQFDGVMNYPVATAVFKFIPEERIGVDTFASRLAKIRAAYSDSANHGMLNLLGSHDIPRALHRCLGNVDKLKLMIIFQMTYIGVPMIYYGDEIGLSGGSDPHNRRCMCWDISRQNHEILNFYKKLIGLRRELLPLRRGNFIEILRDDLSGVYAFLRQKEKEQVIVIMNNNYVKQNIELNLSNLISNKNLVDKLNNREYKVQSGQIEVELSPYGGAILV